MNNWTLDETIIAFNAYCKIPFKNSSKTHPLVVKYSKIIGRTPSALNMKIGNLGRLDPKLKEKGIVGLSHGAKLEQTVWDEFYKNPEEFAYRSECLVKQYEERNKEQGNGDDIPEGTEREVVVKERVNQSFFRAAVLSSYNFRCCITGVGNTELLEACHIMDWAEDEKNRTNPENGLCLTPTLHKAYDKDLLAITPDYKVIVSPHLQENTIGAAYKQFLGEINNRKISLPDRFLPDKDFLALRYERYLKNT
jgi:putative restriction endonuclease